MRPLDRRVLPHLRPATRPLAVVVLAGCLGGALLVGQAFAVAALVSDLVVGRPWQAAAAWLVALVAVRALTGWAGDVAAARASGRVATALRRQVVGAAFALDASSLSRRRTGELALLATRGVAAVEPYGTRYLPALVLAGVLPPLTLLAIASQERWAAVVVLATLPLVPVFAALIGMSTQHRAERQWRALSSLSGHFVDVVRGLPTLVAFNRAGAQAQNVRAVTHRYRRASAATLRLAFASSAVLELVATLSVALVAVTVGLRLAAGGLDLRTALVVLLLAPEAYWPLRRVGAEFHAAAEGTATFEQIHALTAEAAPATSARQEDEPAAGRLALDRLTLDRLTLDRLTLGYGDAPPVVRSLDATIPVPGLTAIVGPSGCGKSTLLAALVGELTPREGAVLVDGRRPDPDHWRRQVAFLPQRPWLTDDTVAGNVRIGRPDADDDAVWAALREVALAETVAALPRGLETSLGDDGAGLSAGQQARLALARVLVSDRPVVVLDEPTAHLDDATESVLLDTLAGLARDRAVVVVAHRDAVVAAADHAVRLPAPASAPALSAEALTAETLPAAAPADADGAPAPRRVDARVTAPAPDEGSTAPPWWRRALGPVLAVLASASGVALTATAGWLIVRASEHPPVLVLMVAIIGVRTFGLARPALRYAERLVSHDDALTELATRRAAVYDTLVPLVPGRLGPRGELLGSVVDDVDALLDRRLRVRLPVFTWIGVTALAALLALLVAPAAGAVVAASGLVGGTAAWWCGRSSARRHEAAYVAERGLLSRQVLAAVSSARQLVLWQRDAAVTDEIAGTSDRAAERATASARGHAGGRTLALLAAGAGMILVTAAVSAPLARGVVSGPMAALLVLLPLALVDVTVPLADAGTLAVRSAAALGRLDRLAGLAPAVDEPAAPRPPAAGPRDVRLAGVTAGWEDRPVLRDLELALPAGGRLGVVGPSGCGKSTLAAVLLRFLAPQRGQLLLAGTDAATLGGPELRRHVTLVPDETYLFASTLRENLRLARPGADDAQLEDALRTAGLGGWRSTLPQGLETMLGDGHATVSGGERSRLGIARALLSRPDVLVLDEPTAHLDTATARAVTDDVLGACAGRSLVWITHGRVGLDRMDAVVRLSGPGALQGDGGGRGAAPEQGLAVAVDVGSLPPDERRGAGREQPGEVLAGVGVEAVDEPVDVPRRPRDRGRADPVALAGQEVAEVQHRTQQGATLRRVAAPAEGPGGGRELGERSA
ncbi:MAG TPA: thiol reductant ABC exporter subunit CydD [Marmoricola sp.]|nr:thiol reductant ABC exporter subunit CydD [Marmoricola sp.]